MKKYKSGMAAAVVGLSLLASCKTHERILTIETVRTDTTYITRHERDSIYMHDSIHVHEKGDTVTVERWHTRWRDRWRYDTIFISKTDTVPRPYPVEVEVPARLTWWQKTLQRTGSIALILLLVWIGRMAWKIYAKRFY